MLRSELVEFLDTYLNHAEVPEPYGTNGLQFEGKQEVKRVGFAVDACLQAFEALHDCDFLVVHHGLFWPSIRSIKGSMRQALGLLFQHDISLYASHLPLDIHSECGNNACLIREFGWERQERFDKVGYFAQTPGLSTESIEGKARELLGAEIRLLRFGPERVERVAVSSGGGGVGMLHQAAAGGAELFLTGEASHPIYHAARELGVSVLLGGHYATETWGVRALMKLVQDKFALETRWVDFPTGF